MSNIFNSFNMFTFFQRLLAKSKSTTGSALEVNEELLDTLDAISQNLIWCKALLYIIVLAIAIFIVYGFFYFILSRFLYDYSVNKFD